VTYTSVSRDKLQQAFGLAHKLSESPSIPDRQRKQFRAIAILIWEAHGEPGAPPPESGAILLAKFGVYGEATAHYPHVTAPIVEPQQKGGSK